MTSTLTVPAAASMLPAPARPVLDRPVLDRNDISVRRYIILGCVTLLALFGGIGGWAAFTDMAGAVLASGSVVVAGNIKKVQHPTGGVIKEILVKNGDSVKTGDILVRLDETVTRASLQLVTKQIDELTGRMARLKAERDDAPSVVFPQDLIARSQEPDVAEILKGEQVLFEARIQTRANQKQQLGERITGLRQIGRQYSAS